MLLNGVKRPKLPDLSRSPMHHRHTGTGQAGPLSTPCTVWKLVKVVWERLHAELFMRYKHIGGPGRWPDYNK